MGRNIAPLSLSSTNKRARSPVEECEQGGSSPEDSLKDPKEKCHALACGAASTDAFSLVESGPTSLLADVDNNQITNELG